MIVTHEVRVARRCPVDGATDIYSLAFEANCVVNVERILDAIKDLPSVILQEEMTIALAAATGCRVTSVGWHSGVKTTCRV